jgi:predicted aspartyl protease
MLKVVIASAALLAWSVGWAQETSLVLNPQLDYADAALRSGSIEQLDSLLLHEKNNPARIEMLKAYLARVQGDATSSDAHAIRCAAIAKKSLRNDYNINYKCKSLLAGNALIKGDYPKWSRLIHSATDDIEDFVRKTVQEDAPGQYTTDVDVLAPAAVSIQPIEGKSPQFSFNGSDLTIGRQLRGKDPRNLSEPFRISAQIDGLFADFAFDTGGSATVIGGRTADALGLKPQGNRGHLSYDLIFEGRQVDVFFAHVKSLKIGALTAKDITVLVSDDPSVENVIGLDLIQAMGQFKISAAKISLQDKSACKGSLRIASDLTGGTKFIVGDVEINGKSVPVDIDTGNGEQLVVYQTNRLGSLEQASVEGLPFTNPPNLKKSNDIGSGYNLGNNILNYYDMTIDIKRGLFCIAKATSKDEEN